MAIPNSFKKYFLVGIAFLFFHTASFSQRSLIDSLEYLVKKGDRRTEIENQHIGDLYQQNLDRGNQLFKQKKYHEAANIFHRCFKVYPPNSEVLIVSGSAYALAGEADSAIAELELKFKTSNSGKTWKELEEIKSDHDFDPIKNTPQWKKFIETLDIIEEAKNSRYQWGILFGVMAVLMLYNFFLYISIKDISYLSYSILIFVQINFECVRTKAFGEFVTHHISSMGYLKWIEHPFPFLVSLMTISYILFFVSFLKLKELDPRSFKILRGAIFLFAAHSLVSIFYGNAQIGKSFEVLTFAAYIYLFNVTFNCWIKKKYKPARFLTLAAVVITLSIVVLLFEKFGLNLNFKIGVFRLDNIGELCFMTLLSFALGDRINILAKEKAEAQEKALEVLEQKVQERTKEVVEKSKIIEEKNEDILASITYARRIQRAHLPTEKYLDKIFAKFRK
jgi:hypothetical protein